MAGKIYKYASPGVASKIFGRPSQCLLKCSFPRDFNDPYELFLTINFDRDPEELAFYFETIGELPQLPTTCFSRSPAIVPMWAHYADNHQGFVIEFDEQLLLEHFPQLVLEDVDYLDGPDRRLESHLETAFIRRKPRHIYWLQRAVFSAAYYAKFTCWSYEQERRLIAREDYIEELDGNILLPVPGDCVTAVIGGWRIGEALKSELTSAASEFGCPLYEMRIGRSSPRPYFVDASGATLGFIEGEIAEVDSCDSCREPITDGRLCARCSITKDHERSAALGNPMRMLEHLGLLDDYYESAAAINAGARENTTKHGTEDV